MAIDEGERLRMVGRLREALGADAADTLMGYLPPVGWGDVATRSDLVELRAEFHAELGGVRGEIGELRGEIGGVRGEIGELRGEFREFGAELRSEMSVLRSDMHSEMSVLRSDMHADIADLRTDMANLRSEVHHTITTTTRAMFFGLIGAMGVYGTAIVAAVRLH